MPKATRVLSLAATLVVALSSASYNDHNVLFATAFQPLTTTIPRRRTSTSAALYRGSNSRCILPEPHQVIRNSEHKKYRQRNTLPSGAVFRRGTTSLYSSSALDEITDDAGVAAAAAAARDSEPTTVGVDDNLNLSNTQLVLNAILLISAFGFALFTILKVDEGMTRGWTQAEIMMRIPVDNWRTYEFNLQDSPIETKTFINVIIYLLGDWLSQTVFKKKNILQFDAMQTLRNGFIGLCFGPLVHEYYEFSDRILPVDVTINRLYKILMDQTLYLGVKCSMYIVAVGVLGGDSWEEAVQSVKDRIKGVMVTAWKFWPLVHCVTYGLIPARHRILWVNCVDLVWNAILASKARDTGDEGEQEEVVPDMIEEGVGKDASVLFSGLPLTKDTHGLFELLRAEPSIESIENGAVLQTHAIHEDSRNGAGNGMEEGSESLGPVDLTSPEVTELFATKNETSSAVLL